MVVFIEEHRAKGKVMAIYRDEWDHHIGFCNACDEEQELGQECAFCEDGEVVPYDDDEEDF